MLLGSRTSASETSVCDARDLKLRVLSAAQSDFSGVGRVVLVVNFSGREGTNQCEAIPEVCRSVILG